ncbi:MAG: hypothetical protein AMXMBFR82_24260 [Candidatus Hydrogenedentota bacterium]
MPLSPLEYLRHILDECDYLMQASVGLRDADFRSDPTIMRAFVRSLEIIGEASKKVPPDVKKRHPGIEWTLIGGMRDRLIHGYFGVDYDIVWDVVISKVPHLREQIIELLRIEGSAPSPDSESNESA